MSAFVRGTADAAAALFTAAVASDPTRPLLTYYDDASGERTELSGATLDNWVAKTANLLVDGHGLGTGDTAAVLLPPHWQTAAVLLGCWVAGLSVPATGPVDVAFATADRLAEAQGRATDVYGLSLAALAAPMRPAPPPGVSDYAVEVRGYGDTFPHRIGTDPRRAGADGPYRDRAAELGITAGSRVLIDADAHPDPVDWLLAPLAANATTVLCVRLDPAELASRSAAERVTVQLV